MPNDLPDWTRQGTVPVFVQNISGSAGGTVVFTTLPAEAVGIECIPLTAGNAVHVNVVGTASGKTYIDFNQPGLGQILTSPPLDTRDFITNGIQTTITSSLASNCLLLILCAGAAFVSNSPNLPLWVTATTAAGIAADVSDRLTRQVGRVVLVTSGNFTFINDDQGGGNVNLGVSLFNARAAPWQSPNKVSVSIGTSIAALGTFTVVSAVAGQVVRPFDVSLAFDTTVATGAVELQDTNGTGYHQFTVGSSPSNPYNGRGQAWPVGLGMQLKNLMGANAAAVRGSAVFSQS